MRRKPGKHFQPWTLEDVAELKRLMAEGTPVPAVAKALGRTREAVSARAKAEGVSQRRAVPQPE